MLTRRLAACLTATLLLRLNFVAVDLACARHDAAARQHSEHVAAASHHHEDASPADTHDERDAASCELPARSDCCQALASCGITLGDNVAYGDGVVADDGAQRSALGGDRPVSRTYAPDPPPPKA